MSQKEKLPLVGYIEIAKRAGVRRPVVTQWRGRFEDFPEPVADLQTGPVWWWPDVEKWLKMTGREYDAGWSLEQVRQSGLRFQEKQELDEYRDRFGPLPEGES